MTAEYAQALAERLRLLTGCVNLRPFWDDKASIWRDPGTLLMTDSEIVAGLGSFVRVWLSHDPAGWNTLPSGKRNRNQPYPNAVFPPGFRYLITEAVRAKQ